MVCRAAHSIKPARRALNEFRHNVVCVQRWWRTRMEMIDCWLAQSVRVWDEVEKGAAAELGGSVDGGAATVVPLALKEAVLLDDLFTRRRLYIGDLEAYRRALRLFGYAVDSHAFMQRAAERIQELRRSRKHRREAAIAASAATTSVTAVGQEAASESDAAGVAAVMLATVWPMRPGNTPLSRDDDFGGRSVEAALASVGRRPSADGGAAGGGRSRRGSAGAHPAEADDDDIDIAVPFRVALRAPLAPEPGESDQASRAAQEEAKVLVRVLGQAEVERCVRMVQRRWRGHLVRHIVAYDPAHPASVPPTAPPERPHFRWLVVPDRIPRLAAKARARVRSMRQSSAATGSSGSSDEWGSGGSHAQQRDLLRVDSGGGGSGRRARMSTASARAGGGLGSRRSTAQAAPAPPEAE